MILMSYWDMSHFVPSYGEYVAIKLKLKVRQKFLVAHQMTQLHIALNATLYHDLKTSKYWNRCIFSLTTCGLFRHACCATFAAFVWYIIKH